MNFPFHDVEEFVVSSDLICADSDAMCGKTNPTVSFFVRVDH